MPIGEGGGGGGGCHWRRGVGCHGVHDAILERGRGVIGKGKGRGVMRLNSTVLSRLCPRTLHHLPKHHVLPVEVRGGPCTETSSAPSA